MLSPVAGWLDTGTSVSVCNVFCDRLWLHDVRGYKPLPTTTTLYNGMGAFLLKRGNWFGMYERVILVT